jgi:hypothetical protein
VLTRSGERPGPGSNPILNHGMCGDPYNQEGDLPRHQSSFISPLCSLNQNQPKVGVFSILPHWVVIA